MLVIGGLAPIFDTAIVSVALHTLAGQLHTSLATIQWVSTAYLLPLGVTIPLAGSAQGRFGGKRVWMSALVIFLAGSIASSLAWSAATLIAFRAVQGIGGGLMAPLMYTLVMQAAAGKALGRAMSVVSLPASLGPVLGPVLGGVILNWLDWRWLFWVNVPFCVAGLLLAWKLLPAGASATAWCPSLPTSSPRKTPYSSCTPWLHIATVARPLVSAGLPASTLRRDLPLTGVAGSLSAVCRRHPARRQRPRIMRTTGAVSHTGSGDRAVPGWGRSER